MAKYLLDTNIYINCYERYYLYDYFPSFWESFEEIINSNVIIPKVVLSETTHTDWFKDWIKTHFKGDILDHKQYASAWAEVLTHIQNSDFYSDKSLTSDNSWTHEKIADPWIIAIAKQDQLTLVTAEIKNNNLDSQKPSQTPKIPDIADDLGVKCISMNDFFGEVGLRI